MKTIDEVRDFLLLDLRNQEQELFDMSIYEIETFVEHNYTEDDDDTEAMLAYYADFNNVENIEVDDGAVTIYYTDTSDENIKINYSIEYFTDDLSTTRIEGYIIYIRSLLNKLNTK